MAETIYCEACSKAGVSSKMSLYQINFEEAILMCGNTECVFTLDSTRLKDFIVTRKVEDLFKNKSKKKLCMANQKLQVTGKSFEKTINWENIDALCWLNSTLNIIVHNHTIKQLISKVQTSENSLLKCLVDQYAKAQYLSEVDLTNAKKILKDIRDLVWTFLQPKMKCTLGVNDSPLFALLLLLKENFITAERCIHEYDCEFNCQECGHTETIRQSKYIITIPNTPKDFNLQDPSFVRSCNKCSSKNQYTRIVHKRIPDTLFFHFIEGLNTTDYLDYKFNYEDYSYHLTQIIQYKNNPNHFICWSKQNDGTRWLELDDLKPCLHSWSNDTPKVPPSEVHIIALQRITSTTSDTPTTIDQQVNNTQTNTSVLSSSNNDASLHEGKLDNSVKQDIVQELQMKCKITSDSQETQSRKSVVDCNANRLPFRDIKTPNSTTLGNGSYKRPPLPSTICSSRVLQYRVKLKRLSSGFQFQPFIPKNHRALVNEFQPYVPKKERLSIDEKSMEDTLNPCSPTSAENSPGDSGYSSPSSVSSCSSSVNCNKDECIVDQLEKLLPDCLSESVMEFSTEQDDFIQQLLFD